MRGDDWRIAGLIKMIEKKKNWKSRNWTPLFEKKINLNIKKRM